MNGRKGVGFVIAVTLLSVSAARGASSIYMPVEKLAASSPLVVEASVVRTASGFDSATGALSTYVTIDVSFVHRGPAGLDRLVVREPGGSMGDLVHVVDAVPVFHVGERVILFLEPARDRSLRVAGMFFGKLELIEPDSAVGRIARRDLSGSGLILSLPAEEIEEFPAREIESVIASVPYARPQGTRSTESQPGWLAVPPEYGRLTWDDVRETSVLPARSGGVATTYFVPISTSSPARWHEADASNPIAINIQTSGNPLNDATAAVNAIRQAMAAWTNVPEARIVLQSGNENYGFTGANPQSPAVTYPPVNVVLFNDPYGDIADPSGCSGTLAIGGYWRSGSGTKVVNNVTFYPLLRQYVIFNNNFQCFLGNASNLAEVAAHELGHGIGFGHSSVSDSIMRSIAYGNGRGARLGDDDRDAAHCHYPHALAVGSPDGGESWEIGSNRVVTWSATTEVGPDPGLVDLEYSADSGGTWSAIRTGEPNDGSYAWTVGAVPGSENVIRVVRHNRVVPTPAPYPEACSKDASNSPFLIVAAAAGTVPDGSLGAPLRVDKGAGSALTVSWGASCSATATNYAIYEGTLSALRSGLWDHAPRSCAAGTDLTESIFPGSTAAYYLVAPLAAGKEGLLGRDSSANERPPSTTACVTREPSSCF